MLTSVGYNNCIILLCFAWVSSLRAFGLWVSFWVVGLLVGIGFSFVCLAFFLCLVSLCILSVYLGAPYGFYIMHLITYQKKKKLYHFVLLAGIFLNGASESQV